mmetsp:Transcript_14856/g.52912  ORF Transcript_14856/g.52912 Transcript_14856/m.52912 type:complete len:205 (-) Transcript_14856:1118-1732(-)
MAPRVAQLHQLQALDLAHLDERVGVAADDAALAAFGVARRRHHKAELVVLAQHVKDRRIVEHLNVAVFPKVVRPLDRAAVLRRRAEEHVVASPPHGRLVLAPESISVVPRQRLQRPNRVPAREVVVASDELGKSLLQEQHPELAAGGLAKDGFLGALSAGNAVVDDDGAPLLLRAVVQSELVASSPIRLGRIKRAADHVRELCR